MGDDKTAVNALNKLLLFAGLDATVVIIIVFFFYRYCSWCEQALRKRHVQTNNLICLMKKNDF